MKLSLAAPGKTFKNARLLIWGYAGAGIPHLQTQHVFAAARSLASGFHADTAMLREFYRIAHQVAERLPQTKPIPQQNGRKAIRNRELQLQPFFNASGAEQLQAGIQAFPG